MPPENPIENLTGFIVEVTPAGASPVEYECDCDSEPRTLRPGDSFVGYFWQMTGPRGDGSFAHAHVHETELIDEELKLFRYGPRAIFPSDEVSIRIRALRSPDSNNRPLPPELKQYETWHRVE